MKKAKKCNAHVWRIMGHDKYDVPRYYILICQKCRKKKRVWISNAADYEKYRHAIDPIIKQQKEKAKKSWKNLFSMMFGGGKKNKKND